MDDVDLLTPTQLYQKETSPVDMACLGHCRVSNVLAEPRFHSIAERLPTSIAGGIVTSQSWRKQSKEEAVSWRMRVA
jgi:hypothetical protein